MTMNGLGFGAINQSFRLRGGDNSVNEWRVRDIISEILGVDTRDLMRSKPTVVQATHKLVDLCKANLVGFEPNAAPSEQVGVSNDDLARIARFYEIDLNHSRDEIFALVPQVLQRCMDVERDGYIDFVDQLWLPVVLNLPVFKYDVLLVDEAQDLNRCQHALAKMAGRRLVFCGDPRQAIYGFTGADAESMNRLEQELGTTPRGCVKLYLTVTRRCGKAIVNEARQIVKDFEAFEQNGDGLISRAKFGTDTENGQQSYHAGVLDGDMVLCRVNAPLVSQCFRFIKAGRKANIMGRDVAKNLVTLVDKLTKLNKDTGRRQTDDVVKFVELLSDWEHKEVAKEQANRNPSEARVIAIQDKADCLRCFTEGIDTVGQVIRKINEVFAEKKCPKCNRSYDVEHKVCATERCEAVELILPNGIRLSSIHKAKGLESRRVFLLEPEGASVPHPMAKSPWQREQEWNLRYVAITRAIEELVYVS
jgi:hypothetical protein